MKSRGHSWFFKILLLHFFFICLCLFWKKTWNSEFSTDRSRNLVSKYLSFCTLCFNFCAHLSFHVCATGYALDCNVKAFSASFQENFYLDYFLNNLGYLFLVSKIFLTSNNLAEKYYSYTLTLWCCNELKKSDFKISQWILWQYFYYY